jgi:hypothetical protein
MWAIEEFFIDSTKNLVARESPSFSNIHILNLFVVHADWHLVYNADAWAFVPVLSILNKIKKTTKGTFAKVRVLFRNIHKK